MQKAHIITLGVILFLLILGGTGTYLIYKTPRDAGDSDAKKSLTLGEGESFTDLEGNSITLEAYEGTVRVVNSWASWTPFSAQELLVLEELAKEYDGRVVFIALNRGEEKELAKQFIASLQAPFEKLHFVLDPADNFYPSVGGYAMPETIIFDTKGDITVHKRGSTDKEGMKVLIEEALNGGEQ